MLFGVAQVSALSIVGASNVLSGQPTYVGGPVGTLVSPPANKVQDGEVYGVGGDGSTGTLSGGGGGGGGGPAVAELSTGNFYRG